MAEAPKIIPSANSRDYGHRYPLLRAGWPGGGALSSPALIPCDDLGNGHGGGDEAAGVEVDTCGLEPTSGPRGSGARPEGGVGVVRASSLRRPVPRRAQVEREAGVRGEQVEDSLVGLPDAGLVSEKPEEGDRS